MEILCNTNERKTTPRPHAAASGNHRFDPGGGVLLDMMKKKLDIATDRALSRALLIDTATLSRIRNRLAPVPAAMIVRMLEVSDLSIHELKEVLRTEPEVAPEQPT
jgi:hypothetical protein